MNLLIIDASTRSNGNANFLAKSIADSKEGAELVTLRDKKINQCVGCKACKTNNSLCVVNDDMQQIYPKLIEAEKVVILSPNYMGFITGACKTFVDRWYAMKDANKKSRFQEGAKGMFILTQGSTNRAHGELATEWFKRIYEGYGLKPFAMTVLGCSSDNLDGAKMKLEEVKLNISMF